MGEDFLRRKNEAFVRHRDEVFETTIARDLFSDARADECFRVLGTIVEGASLSVGDELWGKRQHGDTLALQNRAIPAAICDGPDASVLPVESNSFIARVDDVDPADCLVALTVRPVENDL